MSAASLATSAATGIGDGVAESLPYLRDLGVDAVWLSPIHPSPDADLGYDITDYVNVDPRFGAVRRNGHRRSTTVEVALFFHLLGAFVLVAGVVVAGVAHVAARRRRLPDEIALLLGLNPSHVGGGRILVVSGNDSCPRAGLFR